MNIGTGSPKPHHDAVSNTSRRASVVTLATTYKQTWKDRLIPKAILEAENLLRDLQAIATDSDRVEEEMEDIINSKSNSQHINFARVSANNGVAEIQLDDWRSLDKIEQLTRAHLQRPEVQAKLQVMADELAKETLRRRQLLPKKMSWTSDPPALLVPPFLRTEDDVAPLPSPVITLSRPNRDSQHTAPLTRSPISSLTTGPRTESHTDEAERSRKIPSSNYRKTRADPSPDTVRVQYPYRPGHLDCAQGQSQSTLKVYTGPSSQCQRITWHECAKRNQREKILESEMGWVWESWGGDARCCGRQAEEANDCILKS